MERKIENLQNKQDALLSCLDILYVIQTLKRATTLVARFGMLFERYGLLNIFAHFVNGFHALIMS